MSLLRLTKYSTLIHGKVPLKRHFEFCFSYFMYIYYSVRKVSDLFCENQVDFNEARLHEATLKLHTHA